MNERKEKKRRKKGMWVFWRGRKRIALFYYEVNEQETEPALNPARVMWSLKLPMGILGGKNHL